MITTYSLKAPLLSTFIFMLGHGPYNTFFGLDLQQKGIPIEYQGMIHSIFFLGLLLGPLYMEKVIPKVGYIRMFCCSSAIYGATIAFQALVSNIFLLASSRFFSGYALSVIYVVIESWLLLVGNKENRGKALSYYMVALYGGMSLGQLLLKEFKLSTLTPYLISLFLVNLSILPVSLTLRKAPFLVPTQLVMRTKFILKKSFLGTMAVFISGLILSNIYTLLPVYILKSGTDVSLSMFIIIASGGILQYPIGKMSDRINRKVTILAMALLIILFCFIPLLILPTTSPILFYLFSILLGGVAFSLYPLGMAYVCEDYDEDQIVKVTSYLMIFYSLGSVVGPFLSAQAMAYWGSNALVYSIQSYALILILIFFIFQKRKKRIPSN